MPVLCSGALERAGFRHAFPLRGASDAELLGALGATRVVQASQVHGARVVLAAEAAGAEADAIVAPATDAVAVGVRVADCVPVLLGDAATGAVAAVHAGWRGIVAGVVEAALERLGAREPLAAVGPCIEACCFEVGLDVAARIGSVRRQAGDKAFVDLRAAVRARLRARGVPDAAIEDVAGCTRHEPGRFHSFRRDGANSGRMLAAIATRR